MRAGRLAPDVDAYAQRSVSYVAQDRRDGRWGRPAAGLRCAAVIRALLPILLAVSSIALGAPDAWAGTDRSEDGHLIRWDDGLESMAKRAVRNLPLISKQVEAALGFEFRGGPAEVIFVSGYPRMRAASGVEVPQWAGGVCIGQQSRIVIRADLVENGNPLSSMITTLRHEWVHLAWSRRSSSNRRRLPLWFEEGLAEEVGGGVTVDGGLQLDFAATFGNLIPFDEITKDWPHDGGRAALAYRQGRSFVRFFRDKSGWDHIQRILAALADGGGVSESPAAGEPFDELVLQYSGSSLSHWTSIWSTQIEEEAEPWFKLIARDFMGTIFFLVGLMALVAYWFMRSKRKRQIEALPDHPMPDGSLSDEELAGQV